jgi:hypothetical protein
MHFLGCKARVEIMQFYQTFGNFRILSYNDKIKSTFCIPGNVGFEHFDVFGFCFCFFVVLHFLAIELSLLRFTDSDYPFDIFKLCFCINWLCLCCHDTGQTWNSKYKVIYWKMNCFPSYCLFSVEDVQTQLTSACTCWTKAFSIL